MLSVLLEGMRLEDRVKLANKYNFPRPTLLTSAIRNLNNIRNICAHHGRLWNRSPADRISPPKIGELWELEHLALNLSAQSRLYGTAAILQYILRCINPSSNWSERLKAHMETLPATHGITLQQAGFPAGWELLPLWKR